MRISIFTKLVLPILLVFTLLVLILGSLIGNRLAHNQITNAQNLIVNFVRTQSQLHLNENDFVLSSNNRSKFSLLLSELTIDNILRIKVWDSEGNILFSDASEIVGKNFKDNGNFITSINGQVVIEIKEPIHPDNIAEQGHEQLMELYVPIKFGFGEVSGVVETYYKMDSLNASIKENQKIIFGYLLPSVLLVFLLVAGFVYFFVEKPIFALKDAANKIASGDMDIKIDTNGRDEVAELAESLDKMRLNLKLVMEEYEKGISPKKKRSKSKRKS